ncbi:MAG: phytoene/squalene synthase family protein [Steroidobacteraceae bacterium]|jgi:phytoene synthase|nr:phytoene/squalene synthase family protein [Steroidobacteraceae bacterium]
MSTFTETDAALASVEDLATCREAIRTGSRTFHAASLILPSRVREPALSLYAFCRAADDAIDESGEPAAALAMLRSRLAGAYQRRPAAIAEDRALADVVARFAIPREVPEALLEGFAWDAERRRYADLSGVLAYAARVAGTVGVMMALLMGARSAAALARAADLGAAMQLSNIARDVGEDARAGRLYLPLDWLRAAGIEPEAFLARPVFSPALGAVVDRLLEAAEGLYARAASGVAALPPECRPAIHAARLMYAEIGREVARRGNDSVSSRAVVPAARKALLLARALSAATRRDALPALAPLPETRFLVDAVVAGDARTGFAASAVPGGRLGVREQILWTLELFERLERRQRLAQQG